MPFQKIVNRDFAPMRCLLILYPRLSTLHSEFADWTIIKEYLKVSKLLVSPTVKTPIAKILQFGDLRVERGSYNYNWFEKFLSQFTRLEAIKIHT